MSNSVAPRLSKWPFLLSDLVLVGFAAFIAMQSQRPMRSWEAALCLVATVAGAWLVTIPYLREYRASLSLAETDSLATTVGQIQNLEVIKNEIVTATGQWQAIREQSAKTVSAAQEITDKMNAELGGFCDFLKKSHDAEKNHLKLEVEKLRRGEAEWLKVVVHLLDHVFALHSAASRTRQPGLIAQLDQFQFACRDVVRRIGLLAFAPAPNEHFNPQAHQLQDPEVQPPAGASISEVIAPGYTFQSQMVRRALVRVVCTDQPEGTESKEIQAVAPSVSGPPIVAGPISSEQPREELSL